MTTSPPEGVGEGLAVGDEAARSLIEGVFDTELNDGSVAALAALDTPHRVLFVHAHPDDESIVTGLTMAVHAGDGAGVTLVTCTRGEQGEIIGEHPELLGPDGNPDSEKLAAHRVSELAVAMEALGVADHRFLGDDPSGHGRRFRDSGMVWIRPGVAGPPPDAHPDAFANADLDEAASELVSVLREVRPQVVVTYEPGGGYGHPDHVMTHRVTMRAVELAAMDDGSGEPWQVTRVLWVVTPRSVYARLRQHLEDRGLSGEKLSQALAEDAPAMVVDDDHVAIEVHAPRHLPSKAAALRAHRTQVIVEDELFALSNLIWRPLLTSEYFQVGYTAPHLDASAPIESFFDGVN